MCWLRMNNIVLVVIHGANGATATAATTVLLQWLLTKADLDG